MDPIGGIQQKMVGAQERRRDDLPDPGRELPGYRGRRCPPGMRLIKVSSLAGAVAALDALKAGRPVPAC